MQAKRISNDVVIPQVVPPTPEQVYGVPKVTCLCATKGRYELLRSSIAYFLLQDYPNKELVIFNNHATPMKLSPFLEKQGNIRLINGGEFDSIAEVYNTALTHVDENTKFVSIWDDDDIYFPWHISTGVKYLVSGEKFAWQPKEQLGIDENHEQYPKVHALRNNCEGSMMVQYDVLKEAGFGPGENADEHNQQHPHPKWTHHVNQNGGFVFSNDSENSYVYFWGDKNRGKPWYVHLTNGRFEGNTQNSDTGHGRLLYPGPTYYDFICANLWQKTWEIEYAEHERIALVERINSYDWEFFEERKLFTFWEGEKPYFIQKCLESMEKNSNCLFEVWDTEKLKAAFSNIPVEYDSLCVEFKSDYARQRILSERGGMWLDADMFVVADLYESVLAHTWSYDQVQPLENNGCSSVNICAMACRPKSQVFKKALESVNAVMPLCIGWGDLLNTPTKYAIREGHARGLVKYIPEPVVSLRFVQSPHGGFNEIYSSTTIPLEEIVLEDTAVVTLHSSQIRHHQKGIMPKDYLLQRLIDKYLESADVLQVTDNRKELWTADIANHQLTEKNFVGYGSRPETVEHWGTIDFINGVISSEGISSINDVGCGYFANWAEKLNLGGVHYTGFDIVGATIDTNNAEYPHINFYEWDIVFQPLPYADLVIARDLFFHFNNECLHKALRHIKQSGAKYLLATHHPQVEVNVDMDGILGYRPCTLEKEPYNLGPSFCSHIEEEGGGGYSNRSVSLWKL